MAEIYPVVHLTTVRNAIIQSEVALDKGADGVFLINHQPYGSEQTVQVFNKLSTERPEAFIGVNLLDLPSSYTAFRTIDLLHNLGRLKRLPNAVWVDDATFDKEGTVELREYNRTLQKATYFGGIAFKGTAPAHLLEDPGYVINETRHLKNFVDVITTSGNGTGIPPSIEKIEAIHEVLPIPKPVAVASGINSQNVRSFRGLVDKFLVSSSIEEVPGGGIFNEYALQQIIDTVHEI